MMRVLKIMYDMFHGVIVRKLSVVQTMFELANTYTLFYEQNKNYFRMLHFFNTPQFHKQVSEEMMQSCDRLNQSLWEMITEIISQGITEHKMRMDLDPIEIAIVLWSNASTLLMRIDGQHDMFKEKLHIDLNNTLRVSNILFLESVLTDDGRKDLKALLN